MKLLSGLLLLVAVLLVEHGLRRPPPLVSADLKAALRNGSITEDCAPWG